MPEVTWELSNGLKPQKMKKLAHKQPFEITDKTPKAQIPVIEGWNEMRQCLIDNGLMETN
jgi:hypothetical protein